jgi:hypothetical protein
MIRKKKKTTTKKEIIRIKNRNRKKSFTHKHMSKSEKPREDKL